MNSAFGSSMTGDISEFARSIKERDQSISFTVDDGFNFKDRSDFRVLHQVEPPEVLDVVQKIVDNHNFYDLIVGWNERVLQLPNAVFLPEAVCSWIPRKKPEGFVYQPPNTDSKQYAASFLTSNKAFCPGHKLRVEIYHALKEKYGDLKIVKHMSPPRIDDKRTIMGPYQFHIAVENAMHRNWFADKIVDCFVAKTIPVYWGCPNLPDYFNMDGVILFKGLEDLPEVLEAITPETYQKMLLAVEENYERSLKYVHTWDRIEEEIDKAIEKRREQGLKHIDPVQEVVKVPRIRRPLCPSR